MTGTVTVYFNTGFNGFDIPSEPAVLETAQKKTYPDVYYIREDLDKPSIQIKDTYENLANVDYVSIRTATRTSYYFAAPSAISQGVTALALNLDALLTMGGAKNLNYSSGWQERGHIKKTEDTLFGNIASESWLPSQPLETRHLTMIESNKSEIEGQGGFGNRDIVMTNVDLKSLEDDALLKAVETIKGAGTEIQDDFQMPGIPIPSALDSTLFGIWDEEPVPGDPTVPPETHNFSITGTAAYDLNNIRVQAALGVLFSAGQLQLQASYRIPEMYVDDALTTMEVDPSRYDPVQPGHGYDPNQDTGLFKRVVGWHQIWNANQIPYVYSIPGYTPKNKKVYATYRDYIIVNLGSGDMSSKKPYEIYNFDNPVNAPAIRIWADPVSTGKPYARFDYIKDNPLQWADTVKGLQWASVQICLEGASGSMWNSISNAFTSQTLERSYRENDIMQSYSGELSRLSENAMNAQFIYDQANDYTKRGLAFGGIFTNSLGAGFGTVYGGDEAAGYLSKGASNAIKSGMEYFWTGRAMDQREKMLGLQQEQLISQRNQAADASDFARKNISQQINENILDLYKNNNVVAPTILFTPEQNLGLYGYNKFAVYEITKSDEDLKSEDMYYQRFGYSGLHRPLTAQCFKERQYYNYVQAFNVNIKSTFGMRIREKAIAQLNAGVRVWNVLPDASYYELN